MPDKKSSKECIICKEKFHPNYLRKHFMRRHRDLAENLQVTDLKPAGRPSESDWEKASVDTRLWMIWRSFNGCDSVDASHPNERIQECPRCGKALRHLRKHIKKCEVKQPLSRDCPGLSASGTERAHHHATTQSIEAPSPVF
jgi:hypothetical protein